jgi:lysophospholipase L1-like esterase
LSPRAALFVVLSCAVAGCRAKAHAGTAATTSDAAPPAASADVPASKNAPPPTACAPIDPAKVAPFTCDDKVVKTPVPPIEDETGNLAPFFDRLAGLARGRRDRVRVAVYGDSNLTSDFLTGHLRRVLQQRYGDAGHGFVALSRPWESYRHEDVEQGGLWSFFKLYAPTTHLVYDKQYGFANLAAESKGAGAAAWVRTTKSPKAVVGKTVSRFELYYLKQPGGGSFRVLLDGEEARRIETAAESFEAGFDVIDTTDAPHELRVVATGHGPVRFFGASLDRDTGIQIDSLGTGSLTYERLRWVADGTRRVQLARRGYDLVVIWLGANVMWVPPNKDYAKEFVGEVRASLPNVPILILSPADGVKGEQQTTEKRILDLVAQLREVARETGSAYWDLREAMGGDGSIIRFTKRGLTGPDHVHFGPEGSAFMGNRLLCAMSASLTARLEKRPDAGCETAQDAGAGDAR